jgi:hypothetical protein
LSVFFCAFDWAKVAGAAVISVARKSIVQLRVAITAVELQKYILCDFSEVD